MRLSTISWMRGRSPSTTRGVNALLTRLHSRTEADRHERHERLLDEARIAKHRHHVLVPGEHPEVEGTVMDRILRTQAAVCRIRIRQELGVHRGEAVHVTGEGRRWRLPGAKSRLFNGRLVTPGIG